MRFHFLTVFFYKSLFRQRPDFLSPAGSLMLNAPALIYSSARPILSVKFFSVSKSDCNLDKKKEEPL